MSRPIYWGWQGATTVEHHLPDWLGARNNELGGHFHDFDVVVASDDQHHNYDDNYEEMFGVIL